MISGFFFEPNAVIFLIYALRRSPLPRGTMPLKNPRAIKYLKRIFQVMHIWPGSFYALISCAYGAIGNRMRLL